jgi:hypothetical protein
MEDKERVDASQGRKSSPGKEFGKSILFASEASESLRNSESEGLDSTDGARRDSSPMDMKSGSLDGIRRNGSLKDSILARSNDRNHADGMGKRDSL